MAKVQLKKQPFLLMEVLIAIALLGIFAPWLMRLPIKHYQQQIKRFETLEKQRIADWTYSEIKEQLLKRSIPWESLPEFGKATVKISLSDANLHLPGVVSSKSLKRSYKLKCKKEKEGNQGEIFRLYQLSIWLQGSKYQYLILIQLV